MNEEWYVIKNIGEFVDKTRAMVFNNFGHSDENNEIDNLLDDIKPEDEDEFNSILSHDESMIIAKSLLKKQKNKKTNETRYLVSDIIYFDMIQSLNDRMISNLLNTLVNKGLVETAFDENSNDFVFWIKDENKNAEKPETD
jgi:hypothetical protein